VESLVKKALLITALTLGFLPAFGQEMVSKQFSLEQTLSFADNHAYKLLTAQAQVEKANGLAVSAWRGVLPHIYLASSFIRSNDPVTVFSSKLKQGIFANDDFQPDKLNHPDEFNGFSTSINADIPILNFDQLLQKMAADQLKRGAQFDLEWTKSVLHYRVKQAYWRLSLAGEREKALEEARISAEANRDNALAGYEEGAVSSPDYLSTEVRLAELQEMVIIAANQLHQANDELKLLIGMQEAILIKPIVPLTIDPIGNLVEKKDAQTIKRNDLLAAEHQLKAAKFSLRKERSSWLPRVNGFASREWHSNQLFESDNDSWTVGVQASWSLFEGLSNFGNITTASANVKIAQSRLSELQQRLQQERAAAKRDIAAAKQRVQVAEVTIRQADSALSQSRERFREGLDKLSDLFLRESLATDARLRLLKAHHDYRLALDKYELIAGSTNPIQ